MKVVIIIPTYNEKENIGTLVNKIFQVSRKFDRDQLDVLVVDDSSPDGTGELIRELAKNNPRLHLLTKAKKEGLGAAYVAGMNHALGKMDAEVVFEMDGDLSHDPAAVPIFLGEIKNGADLVIGSRYIPGGSTPADWGWKRRLISRFGNIGIRTILGHFGHQEWSNGYRAIRRWLVQELKDEVKSFTGYTFQVAFLHKAFHRGAKVREIPIRFANRRGGQSKFPTFDYIRNTVSYVLEARFRELLASVFFKFCLVGFVGFVINALGLEFFVRVGLPPSVATALGAEAAIVSNFIWNNLWTFSHARLALPLVPKKFIQFNLTSSGAILIQYLVLKTGEILFGLNQFKSQLRPDWPFDWYQLFFVVAVAIGLVWNFFFYSKVIWKKQDDKR